MNPHPCVAFLPFGVEGAKTEPTGYPVALSTFGEHVKKRRLDLGLTQKQVARELGVDETTIDNWEKGHTVPALHFMLRIIEFLHYTPYTPTL